MLHDPVQLAKEWIPEAVKVALRNDEEDDYSRSEIIARSPIGYGPPCIFRVGTIIEDRGIMIQVVMLDPSRWDTPALRAEWKAIKKIAKGYAKRQFRESSPKRSDWVITFYAI